MNEEILLHNSETLKHINKVREKLWTVIQELDARAAKHDASKFNSPEAEIFAQNTPKLAKTEYGTPAYQQLLEETKVAITHHYSKNDHHPEHFTLGIEEMDLLQVTEMLCDWIAATERNKNGNIHKSIEVNTDRFKLSPQLVNILKNTVNRYF